MSAPSQPPPKSGGGLSLYANLLEPAASSATISSGPVLYNQGEDGAKEEHQAKKLVDPALRFQPIRRPVAKQRPKPTFPKAIPGAKSASSAPVSAIPLSGSPAGGPRSAASGGSHTPSTAPIQPSHKSTLADWAAKEEDEWRYGASEKRQRGGRKKKKKREEERETDWDELYDPTRPTNVEEYLRSDEKIREVHEWKDLLYRHRRKRESEDSEMEDEEEEEEERPRLGNRFAPPASFSFAPPPPSSPPPQPADLPDDKTGEDAYARRLAMSKGIPPPHLPPASPPPPPSTNQQDSHIISRAPVRYSQPEPAFKPDPDDARPALGFKAEEEEEEPPRPNLPGQKGFAARLMAKYGWAKGQGLGAEESGIVNPLRVQVEKRRKKADADGGGWAEPAAKARIIGGKKSRGAEDESDGAMSEVVVLRNMLDGIEDLQAEIAEGLGQEIGEECGEKYGRVERLYIHQEDRLVFIKFTDQVSALRAVSELEGRIFAGNSIDARFYDAERFEKGIYR